MVLGRIKETRTFQRVQAFIARYERWLMPSMLVGGTLLDAVQFRLLSIATTFKLMGVYAVICAVAMVFMAARMGENRRVLKYLQLAAPFVQQFTIGALLSTAMLFYWFSGTIGASWPIVGLVVIVMISNEVLRGWFMLPAVQIGVFYFALFSLSATLSAYVFNSLSPWVFLAGGVASMLVAALFIWLFLRFSKLFAQRRLLWGIVTGIFAFMNVCYFLNVIPPIPLSLRDAGVYYSVTRSGNEYVLVGEAETWLERLIPGQTLSLEPGQWVYAYTAIFAPADLETTIFHQWEFHDGDTWEKRDRLSFRMSGGRSEGYRGYTLKTSVTPGKWRVTVETERGQVLGRIYFTIAQ